MTKKFCIELNKTFLALFALLVGVIVAITWYRFGSKDEDYISKKEGRKQFCKYVAGVTGLESVSYQKEIESKGNEFEIDCGREMNGAKSLWCVDQRGAVLTTKRITGAGKGNNIFRKIGDAFVKDKNKNYYKNNNYEVGYYGLNNITTPTHSIPMGKSLFLKEAAFKQMIFKNGTYNLSAYFDENYPSCKAAFPNFKYVKGRKWTKDKKYIEKLAN